MRDAFRALLLTETVYSSRAHAHAPHELIGLFLFIGAMAGAYIYSNQPRKFASIVLAVGIVLPTLWAAVKSL